MSFVFPVLLAAGLLGATDTQTNVVSEVRIATAWHRRVVMRDEQGVIVNDDGQVADKAATAAIDRAADAAAEIADAALDSLNETRQTLRNASGSAATNAHMFALHIAPSTTSSNMVGYVVKTETVGGIDRQWVWYSHVMSVAPNRYVSYETYGLASTNKCEWVDWNSSTNVTVNGTTWTGCKVCTVQRPSWAIGKTCVDCPNDKWGGANGMDFGDITVLIKGEPTFSGALTNKYDSSDVIYFDNGFYKPTPENEE